MPSILVFFLLFLATVSSAGCQQPEHSAVSATVATRECPTPTDDTYYFPEGSLVPQGSLVSESSLVSEESLVPESRRLDRRVREAWSAYLTAAEQVSLSCGDAPRNAYRAYWGGGVGVATLIVTIVQTEGGWRAAIGEFAPFTPSERYVLAHRAERPVDANDIANIRKALQAGAFWSGPVWQQIQGEGTVWMIEAREDGDYRVVTRVIPSPELADAAHLILKAAGVPVPANMSVRRQ